MICMVSVSLFICLLYCRSSETKQWNQCCQLLANVFGEINPKIWPLAKKFGRTYHPFTETVLLNCIFMLIMNVFIWITHFKKIRPLFGHFLENSLIFSRRFFRLLIFLGSRFGVLRPKCRPVGNTEWNQLKSLVPVPESL
jgi:hypothetical protein